MAQISGLGPYGLPTRHRTIPAKIASLRLTGATSRLGPWGMPTRRRSFAAKPSPVVPFIWFPQDSEVSFVSSKYTGAVLGMVATCRARSGTAAVRVWDKTADAEVAGSELTTASSSFVVLQSGALRLVDGHVYLAHIGKTSAGTGEFNGVRMARL